MLEKPVIVIVGPTASGKTGAAIDLAKRISGEIISADSRTIYKGMDIGTAKPTKDEYKKIVHYGFDLVEPDERFTVYDWKKYAEGKIDEIRSRGNYPIVVGGTGLYVDALIFDYQFGENKKDCKDRKKMKDGYLVYGIKWGSEDLRTRIIQREQKMFENPELVQETKRLAHRYDWSLQSMRSNVYQFVWKMINGEISQGEAITLGALDDYHLAKRQMTWFKRNPEIKWCNLESVVDKIIEDLGLKIIK
jgi:hypothetical protein